MIFSEEIATPSESKLARRAPILVLLGPPGAGKGTHASSLSRILKIPHVSTGDLFREHIRNQTQLGRLAKDYIDQGQLVPDELVLNMLFLRVENKDCVDGFILDGFPRTLPQGEALHAKFHKTNEIIALHFMIPDFHLIERITGRIVCKECSAPYHKKNNPPKISLVCDHCQGTLYQRDDDREEIFRKRLEVYWKQTEPLIAFYSNQKNTLREIQAALPREEVFDAALKELCSLGSFR